MKKYFIGLVFIFCALNLDAQVGMGAFMSNNNGGGSGGSGGGGTGVPIDGGLLTVVIGAAGYAFRKLKKSEDLQN